MRPTCSALGLIRIRFDELPGLFGAQMELRRFGLELVCGDTGENTEDQVLVIFFGSAGVSGKLVGWLGSDYRVTNRVQFRVVLGCKVSHGGILTVKRRGTGLGQHLLLYFFRNLRDVEFAADACDGLGPLPQPLRIASCSSI